MIGLGDLYIEQAVHGFAAAVADFDFDAAERWLDQLSRLTAFLDRSLQAPHGP